MIPPNGGSSQKEKVMANGQEKARETVKRFKAWKSLVTTEEILQMLYRGEVSKTQLAGIIGCTTAAFRQNPTLKNEYSQYMDELRSEKILPPLTSKAKESQNKPKLYENSLHQESIQKRRVSALEQENIELKATVKELERRLERYTELSEAMTDIGLAR